MPVEIRETIVTPAQDGDVVQIHISDAPPGDESAVFDLRLTVKIPKFERPLLLQVQREAIEIVSDHLHESLQKMASQLQKAGVDLHPQEVPKHQRIPRTD